MKSKKSNSRLQLNKTTIALIRNPQDVWGGAAGQTETKPTQRPTTPTQRPTQKKK